MKELKLRAWDDYNNEMIYTDDTGWEYFGCQILDHNDLYCDLDEDSRYPVMQYVGLNDKNGKEIYEGDIVEISREQWENPHGIDYPLQGKLKFKIEYEEGSFLPVSEMPSKHFEVIGNIYENPELLEEE